VSSEQSICDCVEKIIDKEVRIDVLINNAGAGFVKASENVTEEELQWVTDVNYFGVVRCTNAVLPYMRKEKNGHIINITSVGALVGQAFNEFYCAAKFAVEGYTEALAAYLTPCFNIRFTIVEPGGMRTNFSENLSKHLDIDSDKKDPYEKQFNDFLKRREALFADKNNPVFQELEEVASIIYDCIYSHTPPLRIRTSPFANEFCRLKTDADPDGLLLHDRLGKPFLDKE
jgi:NAD(P)-dependent dehydrogenase (short-subunit alcohol dehydrogenase family)